MYETFDTEENAIGRAGQSWRGSQQADYAPVAAMKGAQIGRADAPAPAPAVHMAASETQGALSELEMIAAELSKRLSAVLRPTGPQKESEMASQQIRESCSPMRDTFDDLMRSSRRTRATLLDIMSRLEV